MARGQRHLIKCSCFLPQFRGKKDPPQHHFTVFSVIEDDESVRLKYVQCNNCAAVHKVTDVCKSEILVGKDNLASIVTLEDVKASLPANLVDILLRSEVDISKWEQAQFIFENKKWGEFVVLASEEDDGVTQGKYVRFLSETFFKVETFSRETSTVYTEG